MVRDLLLLSLSLIALAMVITAIAKKKEKGQLHHFFMALCCAMAVWCVINIQHLFIDNFAFYPMWVLFEYLVIGACGPFLLGIARVFFFSAVKINYKFWLLFAIPVLTSLAIPFNQKIHFFYIKYAFNMAYGEFGPGGWIFIAYTYAIILIGIFIMVYQSVKEAGFFSRQAVLICTGAAVPLVLNTMYTLKIIDIGPNATPITFTIFVVLISFAMFKFKLLSIEPIALQMVMDHMTDAFVIVNNRNRIVDYNKSFENAVGKRTKFRRNEDILNVLETMQIGANDLVLLKDYMERAVKKGDTLEFRKHIIIEDSDRHLKIEITPIYSNNKHIGTIIMFKNITDYMESLQTIQDYQALLERNLEKITQDKQELLIRNAITEQMAKTDVLTDMYNHRTFQEYFDAVIRQAEQSGGLLQLAILDIDDFKQINDTFGHAIGDIVLKRISSRIKEMVTADDIPARYGGEEFVIIFTGKTLDDAYKVAESLRMAIQTEKYREIDRAITVSIGLYNYKYGDVKETMFNDADKALYKAKYQGKNLTVIAE